MNNSEVVLLSFHIFANLQNLKPCLQENSSFFGSPTLANERHRASLQDAILRKKTLTLDECHDEDPLGQAASCL
jgi:hypothetical protein